MHKPQAKIFLLDDLHRAKQERDDQLDALLCDMEAITTGLAETTDGEHLAATRDFLARQLGNHLAVLRGIVLPQI